jgi:integrase
MAVKRRSEFGVKGLYQKRGWFYYAAPTPKGGSRPAAVALLTNDLVTAIGKVQEHRVKSQTEAALRSGTVAVALEKYLAAKATDAAPTKRARESILNRFVKDTGNPKTAEITAELIEQWRASLAAGTGNKRKVAKAAAKAAEAAAATTGKASGQRRSRVPDQEPKESEVEESDPAGLSGATVRSYLITLRAFVNWLREEGYVTGDPMKKMKRQFRVARTRRQEFVSVAERDRLLAAAELPDYLGLVLHLGFFAGLRDGEMLAMTKDWVWLAEDGSRGTITVQETPVTLRNGKPWRWRPKTREMRTIPMHPRLLEFVKAYGLREPFMVAPHKPRWPDESMNCKRFECKKALHAAAENAGIPHLTFHKMRHSFATHLAMKGTPLAVIAGLLGDSLRVTEDHYAGFCPKEGGAVMVL